MERGQGGAGFGALQGFQRSVRGGIGIGYLKHPALTKITYDKKWNGSQLYAVLVSSLQ